MLTWLSYVFLAKAVLGWIAKPFKALLAAFKTWRIKRQAVVDERREVARETAERQAEYQEDAAKHRARTGRRSDPDLDKRLRKWTRRKR